MNQKAAAFLLSIPYPLLKKVLYLYLAAIVVWNWSAAASLSLLAIMFLDLLLIGWQSLAWRASILQKYSPRGKQPFIERLRAPARTWVPRLIVVLILSAALAYFLNGFLGFNFIQLFLLPVGYALLYRETNLLGAYTAYIVTPQGIGIEYVPGHFAYRTFIRFEDIRGITVFEREGYSREFRNALCLAPQSNEEIGLLLTPTHHHAFTNQSDTIFIAPRRLDAFLSRVPHPLIRRSETHA